MLFAGVLLVGALLGPRQDQIPRPDCRDWSQCRQLATEAAERQEYETFHDLAWRAVQTGPKNDSALMYLLARAQSLSGRPSDALVMLGRLADMGVATDAATNDDFRRVRALPGWRQLKDKLEGMSPASQPSRTADPVGPKPDPADPKPAVVVPKTDPLLNAGTSGRASHSLKPATETFAATNVDAGEALRFTPAGSPAIGLAYDAVSRRFVIADPMARSLSVVDEFSQHVATLSGTQAAFADIGALEIDPREGDLWVVSSEPAGSGGATTLHKLQLVSGRVLATFALPDRYAPGHFVDVAVTPQSAILALDDAGRRVFRLRPGAELLELVAPLEIPGLASIAPADGNVAYVAHLNGLTRVDLATGAAMPMKAAGDIDLTGISRLRWHRGALVGLQRSGESYRAVRLALDRRERTVTALEPLDAPISSRGPSTATIAGDVLYYLAQIDGGDTAVRRVRLR